MPIFEGLPHEVFSILRTYSVLKGINPYFSQTSPGLHSMRKTFKISRIFNVPYRTLPQEVPILSRYRLKIQPKTPKLTISLPTQYY
jgi:hypothetical protein